MILLVYLLPQLRRASVPPPSIHTALLLLPCWLCWWKYRRRCAYVERVSCWTNLRTVTA
eukprot:COSAG01_NODE_2610_length_7384_cov_12.240906_7_plen_59_part_00